MPVIIDTEENLIVAHLKGEIDHHNAKDLRSDIDLAIDKYHPENVVLDFNDVTFMDSSGIGLVMGRYKITNEYGGRIVVENTSTQIKKVMRLAGLDRLAEIK